MLLRGNRIKKNEEIEKILKKGKSFKEDFLVLKKLDNNLAVSRFAFIVSRKVSKKASSRNKIKRRLREILRPKIKLSKPGLDSLIVALPGSEGKSFGEIKEAVEKLFEKAKMTNGKKNNFKNN